MIFSSALEDLARVRELLPEEEQIKTEKTYKSSLFKRKKKEALLFEADYTALLISLASGVRTGLDPLEALLASVHFADEGKHGMLDFNSGP